MPDCTNLYARQVVLQHNRIVELLEVPKFRASGPWRKYSKSELTIVPGMHDESLAVGFPTEKWNDLILPYTAGIETMNE